MAAGVLVSALGIAAFVLLVLFIYLSMENAKARYPLQVLLFAFLMGIIMLLGKVSLDYQDNCSWLVSSSNVTGSDTSYSYTYNCSPNPNSTASTFYEITLWVVRLVTFYLVIAFAFEAVQYFGWLKKGGKQE